MARPLEYTPENTAKILEGIRRGLTLKAAAALGSVNYSTFREWVNTKPEFSEAVNEAEAYIEDVHTKVILAAANPHKVNRTIRKTKTYTRDGVTVTETEETTNDTIEFDWRASEFFLKHRRNGDYRVQANTDITSNGEAVSVVAINIVPPETKTP